MGDQHQRRLLLCEARLQPFDGRQIEVVGRLVEQQDVGIGRQHVRERRAPRLAAREVRRDLPRRSGQAAPAGSAPDADRRPGRARSRHRPAWWRSRRGPAPAADSGRPRPAARSARRCPARPGPPRSCSSVDLPEPLRPTRHTRSPAETDSSTPSSSGVPPKVSAMSVSWMRGGGIRVPGSGTALSPARYCLTCAGYVAFAVRGYSAGLRMIFKLRSTSRSGQ